MPNPTNELSAQAPIEASLENPTEASNHKLLEEKLKESERLGFLEQARIVREGLRKGVRYDGCTAVPDFDFGADCCGEHDFHYQLQDISRAEADRRLRECILKKGYPLIAWSYWIGVRVFAGAYYRKKQNEIFPLADPDDRP